MDHSCVYLCDDQTRCDTSFGGVCTGIVASQPSNNGYCKAVASGDMGL